MRILVTMLMAIGDGLYATAALSSLKKAWPESKIYVLVAGALVEFVENNPLVEDYVVDRSGTMIGMLQTIRKLRMQRNDMAICFDGRSKTLLMLRLAGIPDVTYVEGMYSRPKLLKKMLSRSVARDKSVESQHVVYQYKNVIEKITGHVGTTDLEIGPLESRHLTKAKRLAEELPNGSGYVLAVSACSSTVAKNWDSDELARVLREIRQRYGIRIYFVGGAADKAYTQRIIETAEIDALNLCGKTSLKELAALLSVTDIFLGVCTGTAHIAAYIGVPCVMIYTCSPFRTWYPFDTDFIPVCSFEDCATGFCDSGQCLSRKCVGNLRSNDVLAAFEYMFGRVKKSEGNVTGE